MPDVAVIGGGAAGFFAAINIKKKHPGLKVHIYEKSRTVLGKVKVSGGGRCNVTHACFIPEDLVRYYPRGHKELLSVFQRFNPIHTIEWFHRNGVRLKTESDGRMFPVSDDSQTIIDCFLGNCTRLDIPVHTNHAVQEIEKTDGGFNLKINDKIVKASKIVVSPGSSEHFWNMLKTLGHTIVPHVPSLFTFNIKHPLLKELMGLSLANATVKLVIGNAVCKANKLREDDLAQSGPLLITHWGLSGPAVLKLSSVAARVLNQVNYEFDILLNLTGKEAGEVDRTLQSSKQENSKKRIVNTPLFNIPSRLWTRLLEVSLNRTDMNWADLSKKDMALLSESLYAFRLPVKGKSTFKEEFVTAGGVDLKEVDFKTMESKAVPGLYLAGEVLNIDALTGGFNFQAAWSEGWVISESI